MADGLDIFSAQNRILEHLTNNLPDTYDVYEGDIGDAMTRDYINGVNQTTIVIQFGDMLPLARDKSFAGPTHDGYYSLVRVMSIAPEPSVARQANSVVNQVMLGFRASNIGPVNKEGGGGAYAIGEANTRPLAYGLMSTYRFMTNIANPGSTIVLP